MSPWSSLGLSGCHGANVSNWKDLFHGVGDQSSALQSGAAALRLDVTTMTLPKHQDSAQSSIKALLASCVEVDSSLTWSLISRPGPTFQNLQFLINAFFFSFCYKLLHCSSHLNSFPWSEGSAMYGLWKMDTCIVNTFYLHIHFCSFQTFSSRLWLWL